MSRWKNYKNRSVFSEDMDKSIVSPFLTDGVYRTLYLSAITSIQSLRITPYIFLSLSVCLNQSTHLFFVCLRLFTPSVQLAYCNLLACWLVLSLLYGQSERCRLLPPSSLLSNAWQARYCSNTLRCDGIFYNVYVQYFLGNLIVNELQTSIYVCRSYYQKLILLRLNTAVRIQCILTLLRIATC